MTDYILNGPEIIAPGCRVLELGSGCGLVGMAMAKYHPSRPEVTLTDHGEALAMLEKNVSGAERCNVLDADWNTDCDLGTFDVIVGTDVMYAPGLIEPLLRVARGSAHSGTVLYLCAPKRCDAAWEILIAGLARDWQLAETIALDDSVPCAGAFEVVCWRCQGCRL